MMNSRRIRHLSFCSMVFAALLAWAVPGAAQAEDQTYVFDIPVQQLGDALRAFARASHHQVTFEDHVVMGKRNAPLKGKYTAQEALGQLLGGSGLSAQVGESGLFIVRDTSKISLRSDALDGDASRLRLAQADGAQTTESGEAAPEEVLVTAHEFREVEIGKSNISLIETPQAISIISGDLIKQRGITDINDALASVAGVSRSSTYGFFDAYTIRGYDTALDSLYLDGLITSNAVGTNNELAGLERVEVLKGPASALYGAAPIGGLVNLVSKRPQNRSFLDASVSTGSYDLKEVALDGNTSLNPEGTLLGRLNLLYRDSDDFVKFSGRNRVYVAPALTWHMGTRTYLTMLASMQRDDDNPWSPVPAEGTVLPNANGRIPYGFAINHGGDEANSQTQNRKSIGYVFDHAFNDDVSFSQTLRYTHAKTKYENWVFAAGFVDSAYVGGVQQGHIIGLYVYGAPYRQKDKNLGIDNRLNVSTRLGSTTHELMLGVDHRRYRGTGGDGGGVFDFTANTIDFLDPDYSGVYNRDSASAYGIDYDNEQTGVYIQDHIGFGEKLFITGGGRIDWVNQSDSKDKAFSPRIGANYLFTPHASVYAVYSRSFTPQLGFVQAFDGSRLDNGEGRNVELGVKVSDPGGAFSGSAAVFELTRLNVATDDPDHLFFYLVTGEQESRGFEMEGEWRLSPGAVISGAYTHISHAKVTEDERIPIGTRLGNVPKHNLYVRGDFTMPAGPLAGLGANVAVQWNSDRVSDTTYFYDVDGDGINDAGFELPSYKVVDAGLHYMRDEWRLQLDVDNVLDKEYFPDASEPFRVSYGRPRNWRLTFSRKF